MRRNLHPFLFSAAAALAIACAAPAIAQTAPSDAPILRVDLGMHDAPIRDLALNNAGDVIATVGDDKTVRLWSSFDGELLETVRAPMDEQSEGILNTAAFWPGESHLLVSGITGINYVSASGARANYVYFIDRKSGYEKILRRAFGGVVNKIAVFGEPSGATRRLAIAHASAPAGVTIANEKLKPILTRDFGAPTNWVEFADDGRLVAAARNGVVAVFSADLQRVLEWRAPSGAPAQARFSPDGAHIAVAYLDEGRIDILSASDMTAVASLTVGQTKPAPILNAVAWDADGGLWAGGNVLDNTTSEDPEFAVRVWRDWREPTVFDQVLVGRDAVTMLEAGEGRALFFATADPAWGRIDVRTADLVYARRAAKPDLRDVNQRLLATNADGSRLALSLGPRGGAQAVFDADALRLDQISSTPSDVSPTPAPEGFDQWRNTSELQHRGRFIRLRRNDIVRSAAQLPDGRAVFGTDYALMMRGRTGVGLVEREIATPALGMTVSADGERLIVAHGDGVMRWYDLNASGSLNTVGALFIDPQLDRGRWILWSPDGYFTHSETGGDELAGFSVNRGFGQTARWVAFTQLYRDRHRPDVMRSRIGRTGDVIELGDAGDPGGEAADEKIKATPEVRITEFCGVGADGAVLDCYDANQARRAIRRRADAGAGSATADGEAAPAAEFQLPSGLEQVEVRYEVAAPPARISSVDVFRSGRSSGQTRAIRRRAETADPDAAETTTGSRRLLLASGANRIQVRAYTVDGVFGASPEIVVSAEPADETSDAKLYVLAVGVNRYPGAEITTLNFARPDAEAIAQKLEAKAPPGYASSTTRLLTDEEATRETILDELAALAETARPQDAVVIYFAGHGVVDNDSGSYFFVHSGVSSWDKIAEEGVSAADMIAAVGAVQAENILVMLDTCHSGAFPVGTAASIANETGYYVLAASSTTQEALDGYNGRNGVFAHAVLGGVGGEAPAFDGVVDVLSLGSYVRNRVPQLAGTKGFKQNAQFRTSGGDLTNFPIARIE